MQVESMSIICIFRQINNLGFVGAASCMAVQTLVSLDEVELKEKKEKESQEEISKLKLVPV